MHSAWCAEKSEWVTPSGFEVRQQLQKNKLQRIESVLFGDSVVEYLLPKNQTILMSVDTKMLQLQPYPLS